MPHCVLEQTSNIKTKIDHKIFFKELHELLTKDNIFRIGDIKSRYIIHHDYYIGDGSDSNAFVTLDIRILSGRDTEIKKKLAQEAHFLLVKTYAEIINKLSTSITVRVTDMERETYIKYST